MDAPGETLVIAGAEAMVRLPRDSVAGGQIEQRA